MKQNLPIVGFVQAHKQMTKNHPNYWCCSNSEFNPNHTNQILVQNKVKYVPFLVYNFWKYLLRKQYSNTYPTHCRSSGSTTQESQRFYHLLNGLITPRSKLTQILSKSSETKNKPSNITLPIRAFSFSFSFSFYVI